MKETAVPHTTLTGNGRAMHPAQFTIYIAPCMIKSNTLSKLDFKKEASCGIMA